MFCFLFCINQVINFDEVKIFVIVFVNDIYDFVVVDFVEAKRLLFECYDFMIYLEVYVDGRANKFVVVVLLVKVYFQMGMYDEVLVEVNFVIEENGGDYDFFEEFIEVFNKIGLVWGKEVIWYYVFWVGDGLGGLSNWKYLCCFVWYNVSCECVIGLEDNGS